MVCGRRSTASKQIPPSADGDGSESDSVLIGPAGPPTAVREAGIRLTGWRRSGFNSRPLFVTDFIYLRIHRQHWIAVSESVKNLVIYVLELRLVPLCTSRPSRAATQPITRL